METPNQTPEQAAMQDAVQVAMLTISNVEPKAEAGKTCVSFRRKKVAEADSYRAVLVPDFKGLDCIAYGDGSNEEAETEVQGVFAAALSDVFMDAASSILRRYCDEKKTATTIPADLLAFSAVVTEMQAQQTSQRLNGDAIAAWYDASKTAQDAVIRYKDKKDGDKLVAALREKYLSLASNNPNVQPALAVKMLAYINPEDTGSNICKAIAKKLDRLSQVSVQADDL